MPEPTARPMSAIEERILNVAAKIMSGANTWLFRVSGGKIGNKFMYGAPVLLLVHKGRKTGALRTSPLIYLADGDDLILVASKGGSAHHPLWYLNITANPEVDVEIGTERRPMRARDATSEEKQRYWPRLNEIYPPYDSYQARTAREIPVVVLSPR